MYINESIQPISAPQVAMALNSCRGYVRTDSYAVMLPQGTTTITFFTVNKRGLFFPPSVHSLTTRNLPLIKKISLLKSLCVWNGLQSVMLFLSTKLKLLRTFLFCSESAYIKLGCFGAVKGGSGPIRRTRERVKGSGGKYH